MGRMLFTVLLATAAVLACSAAPIPDVDSKIGTSVIVNTVARTGIWGRRRHSKMPSSNGKKKVRMMKLRKKEMRNKNKRFSDGNGGNRRQFKLKSLRGQNKKNRLAKKTNRDRKNKRDSGHKKNEMRNYEKNSERELSLDLGHVDEAFSVVRTQNRGNGRNRKVMKKNRSRKNNLNKNHRYSKKGRSRKQSEKSKSNKKYRKGSDRELSTDIGPVDKAYSVVRAQKRHSVRSRKGMKKNHLTKNRMNKSRRSSKTGRSRKQSKKINSSQRKSRHQKKRRTSKKGGSRQRND